MIIEVMKGMRLQTRNAPRRQPRSVKPLLLATACVFIAALGWILYRDHLSGHIAAAEASSAAVYGDDRAGITFEQRLELERTLRRDLEQQLAARLVEQEALQNARRKDVEQQLAARQADQELLAKERARSNDLEQRLAARQTSEQALVLALARGRAHNQALEQELARRANATPGKERDANVRLSAPASDNPTPPAPIEQTAMPAR
jgi:LmbE family N-acetylglucosaminyl deacetylase